MAISLSRRGEVEPFHAMDVLAEANRLRAAGAPVVSMAVGQPSDPAPTAVRDAARLALEAGRIGYTDSLGIPALRQAISAHYAEHYGLDVPPGHVAVTTGSSAGFNLAFLAMFDAGDRVAIASPGYPAYRNTIEAIRHQVALLLARRLFVELRLSRCLVRCVTSCMTGSSCSFRIAFRKRRQRETIVGAAVVWHSASERCARCRE